MSEPKKIGDIMVAIAADPTDDFAKVLRQCPFIQEELLKRISSASMTLPTSSWTAYVSARSLKTGLMAR